MRISREYSRIWLVTRESGSARKPSQKLADMSQSWDRLDSSGLSGSLSLISADLNIWVYDSFVAVEPHQPWFRPSRSIYEPLSRAFTDLSLNLAVAVVSKDPSLSLRFWPRGYISESVSGLHPRCSKIQVWDSDSDFEPSVYTYEPDSGPEPRCLQIRVWAWLWFWLWIVVAAWIVRVLRLVGSPRLLLSVTSSLEMRFVLGTDRICVFLPGSAIIHYINTHLEM